MAKWFLKNPGFELGDQDWNKGTGWAIAKDATTARSGAWRAAFTGSAVAAMPASATVFVRPGGKVSASAWIDGSAATAATLKVAVTWIDKNGVQFAQSTGSNIAFGGAGYAESTLVDSVAPSRAKSAHVRVTMTGTPDGSAWYADDMDFSGDIIESIPASAEIQSSRLIGADTVGRFDPLVGDDKFSEFNAGMSDKWSGVWNLVPRQAGASLNEITAFLRRLGRTERFFAFDPDRTTPLNGVVNGMVVDGAVTKGTTRIPVRGGPVGTTALVAGDYFEAGPQYFKLQRDLEIGPEGTGEAIVWPAVRRDLADGEDIITDNPKMVARVTSDYDWPHDADTFARLSFSWQEV